MANIIDKLQKLISHERSAREIGNVAEAEAFASKVQRLLAEHKLTMSEVEFEAQDKDNPINCEDATFPGSSTPAWMKYLSHGIASSCFCEVYSIARANTQTFVGRDSDRLAAVEMYRYLVATANNLCKKETKTFTEKPAFVLLNKLARHGSKEACAMKSRHLRAFKASFLLGFGTAIYKRLMDDKRVAEGNASEQAFGLILRDSVAIRRFAEEQFGVVNGRTVKAGFRSEEGFQAGKAHGYTVALRSRLALGVA
ncbi:DUF2786 domain-containing protein [Edaphobacter albus]|uniref:DUF2786 domain-containing protein n=1 Tax=Edaphobacter sp. 4G125 TaxID=2763071 RepID=UPI001647A29D|nr:DUF2786 domain-containing protein [Edaphobacter sp. 4G125]QNI37501.1 DUF2786 domain-containing protein [Edaphobacter sp. 4G125]